MFDAVGNVVNTIDARNNKSTYIYDAINQQIAMVDALGNTSTTVFDAASNVIANVDALGNRTTMVFDADNRQIATIDALSNRNTVVYDAVGNVVNTIDALGNKTTYIYDALNQRTGAIDALSNRSTTVYDAAGNVVNTIDANNHKSTYVYDALNQRTVTIDALGDTSTTVYDPIGETIATFDAKGNRTSYYYDAAGREIATFDALDSRTQTVYDAAGNVVATIDERGNATTSVYDADNRRTVVIDALGGTNTTVYDAVGNVVNSIDALVHKSTYVYDAVNRQTVSIDPLSGATTVVFDVAGNRTVLIDPVGNRTTWAYDALNRITQETSPNNKSVTYAYDALSRVTSTTDQLGRRRDFTFNAVGEQTNEKWYDAGLTLTNTKTYTYDAARNELSASDQNGTYTYTFDAINRVATVAEPFGLTLTFGYDANSNRTSVQDSKSGLTTTIYDALNRTSIRQFTGNGATLSYDYTYNATSETATITRFSDLTGTTKVGETDYTYDAKGRMTNELQKNGSGTTILNTTYAYDAGDRLTVQTDNGAARTFTYDNTNQLTADTTHTYTYDANGNRNNGSYTIGTWNQITSDGTWTYSYDFAGNLIKKSKGASAETWNYTYDVGNHLTRVEQHATDGGILQLRIDYTYDVYGDLLTRIQYDGSLNVVATTHLGYDAWKTDSGQSSFVGLENADVWVELDGSNNLTVRRLFGNSIDNLVARIASGGTVNWYLTDRQGSVRFIVNAFGTAVNTVTYDGYGNATQSNAIDWYLFQAQRNESAAGILIFHGRDESLSDARMMQVDPLGTGAGDSNFTRLEGNSFTNKTDPSGLDFQPVPRPTPSNDPLLPLPGLLGIPGSLDPVSPPLPVTSTTPTPRLIPYRPTSPPMLSGPEKERPSIEPPPPINWPNWLDFLNPPMDELSPAEQAWFRYALERIRAGDPDFNPNPVITFGRIVKIEKIGGESILGDKPMMPFPGMKVFIEPFFPRSEPITKITYSDGTIMYLLGGGPSGFDLACQAAALVGPLGWLRGRGAAVAPKSYIPFAQQAGIPDLINLAKPNNVWGLDGRKLQSYFRRKGFDSRIQPPKSGTSGKAEVFRPENHPTIKEVEYHPGGGIHGGSYYKFEMKDGTTIRIIDPNTYIPRGIGDKTTFFNPQGQRIVFDNGKWVVQ